MWDLSSTGGGGVYWVNPQIPYKLGTFPVPPIPLLILKSQLGFSRLYSNPSPAVFTFSAVVWSVPIATIAVVLGELTVQVIIGDDD